MKLTEEIGSFDKRVFIESNNPTFYAELCCAPCRDRTCDLGLKSPCVITHLLVNNSTDKGVIPVRIQILTRVRQPNGGVSNMKKYYLILSTSGSRKLLSKYASSGP
jgi:hypothetical protein